MGFRMDFSKDIFLALPTGLYTVQVNSYEEKQIQKEDSKYVGSPMLAWELEVTDGEHAGRKLFYNTIMIDEFSGQYRRLAEACGQDIDDTQELEVNPDDLIGAVCQAEVGIRKYSGRDVNDIKSLLPT